jgi:hypothetical protein
MGDPASGVHSLDDVLEIAPLGMVVRLPWPPFAKWISQSGQSCLATTIGEANEMSTSQPNKIL